MRAWDRELKQILTNQSKAGSKQILTKQEKKTPKKIVTNQKKEKNNGIMGSFRCNGGPTEAFYH